MLHFCKISFYDLTYVFMPYNKKTIYPPHPLPSICRTSSKIWRSGNFVFQDLLDGTM